jgi:hypothetical protein
VVGSERKMIEVSRKVIIVADHTKFGRAAMVPVAPLDVADVRVRSPDSRLPEPPALPQDRRPSGVAPTAAPTPGPGPRSSRPRPRCRSRSGPGSP